MMLNDPSELIYYTDSGKKRRVFIPEHLVARGVRTAPFRASPHLRYFRPWRFVYACQRNKLLAYLIRLTYSPAFFLFFSSLVGRVQIKVIAYLTEADLTLSLFLSLLAPGDGKWIQELIERGA